MTQILTPIFHALSGREGEPARPEAGVDYDHDPLAAPLPAVEPPPLVATRLVETPFVEMPFVEMPFAEMPFAEMQSPELREFDQPTEKQSLGKRSTLQVVAGRAAGGAHRARSASSPTRSYSGRPGFHSRPAQPGAEPTGDPAVPGAHRAPEDTQGGSPGASGHTEPVAHAIPASRGIPEESGSHHVVSRAGGRHRTLRAVSRYRAVTPEID